MIECIILGGGISGLATAYYLHRLGLKEVILIEKNRVGGKIETVRKKDFIIEKGPNGFLDNKPYTISLSKELGIEEELYLSSDESRHRFVVINGALVEIPTNPFDFFKSSVLSAMGKIEIFKDLLVPPHRYFEDPTVEEFCTKRLGKEIVETLIDPMVAGVYGGEASKLSMKSSFPLLWNLEQRYGSLIKALISLKKEGKLKGGPSGPGGRLTSFRGGLDFLIDSLKKELTKRITLLEGISVKRISLYPGFFKVYADKFIFCSKSLVLSVPAFEAARLLEDYPISQVLLDIPYIPIVVVALAYRREVIGESLKGFGFLVPKKEGLNMLGCLWDSRIFPNRAPEGFELFRVMLGGARDPKIVGMDSRNILSIAKDELERLLKIKGKPSYFRVFKHEKAIPQYTVGHSRKLEDIESFLVKFPGLFLNSNAYRGVGLNDCVYNGKLTAHKVLRYLN